MLAVAAAALVPASAADMYRADAGGYKDAPVYAANTWTGFYLGANGGYGWSSNNQLACPHLLGCATSPISGLNPEGGFGGGQIGYNWQGWMHPNLVLGIEADIQGGDISDRKEEFCRDFFSSKLDWFGTIRGRLGYSLDRTLIYATGGFAYGGLHNEANYNFSFGPENDAKIDRTATGYVIGAGLEYKINPAWSVKAEYQYINLGKNDPKFLPGQFPSSYSALGGKVNDDAFNTVRLGLNYHVGHGYEPLK